MWKLELDALNVDIRETEQGNVIITLTSQYKSPMYLFAAKFFKDEGFAKWSVDDHAKYINR